ncbi:hypothetical protein DB30_04680 [Enhygromyxa salina]|uniref:Uncharacterized protein n=1 Tax=Enhygromyxa salina TaxID=215803 RepID=A0A0C2DCU2_9BACT|nr:hypothetical protein DB30_04680 [Enhygromyxa salina]
MREGVRRRPLTAVGGALLAGFVIGNGTPRFVAQTALSMGLRALLGRVFADGSAALDSLD